MEAVCSSKTLVSTYKPIRITAQIDTFLFMVKIIYVLIHKTVHSGTERQRLGNKTFTDDVAGHNQ
jgi:hypothetical protein